VERERLLTEELEHRAKNTFAMVLAIANQTFRGETHASPLQAYTPRVMALAKVHEIAKKSNWTSTRIGDVIEEALGSYRAGGKFNVSGAELNVAPRQAVSLTLAVNELATNALKYGALSSSKGGVDISWSTSVNGIPRQRTWLPPPIRGALSPYVAHLT
jgi:two-component sensor histidine kinase